MSEKPKKRVLIVEDLKSWRAAIADLVRQIAEGVGVKVDVESAATYTEAVEELEKGPFDCITVDNLLEDGKMASLLLQYIHGLKPPVPVLIVSGESTAEEGWEFAKDCGVTDFFGKVPFDSNRFREKVGAILTGHTGPAGALQPSLFTWVHLSDLHYETSEQRRYQIGQVIQALRDDLTRLRDEHPDLRPDVILFTGDLAEKARPEEMQAGWEQCLCPLMEHLGLHAGAVFLVPGNHDVDRSAAHPFDAGFLATLHEPAHVHALLHDSGLSGYRQQLLQRMDTYGQTMGAIGGLAFDPHRLSWGHPFQTAKGETVGIVGLNSVWTSAAVKGWDDEVDDQGKLIIGQPLVEEALEQANQGHQPPNPQIALVHNPLDWSRDWDQRTVTQVLRERCSFLLHGHVHDATVNWLGSPNPTTMVISAGALHKKQAGHEAYPCLHAYNIVQLDLANRTGTVYFRKFDLVHQRYGQDDTAFSGAHNGQYAFRYGDDGFGKR